MKKACQVYTSLFDILRTDTDGRSIEMYIEWLSKTAKIYPGIIIFHDGCCDGLYFEGAELIKIKKSQLKVFGLLADVKRLFETYKPIAKNDITFKLPEYSLVQFAKFELATMVIKKIECESVLWVDAGISRFINKSGEFSNDVVNKKISYLISNDIDFVLEINLRKNLSFSPLQIKKAEFGTCKRITSGTSYWINAKTVEKLFNDLKKYCEILLIENKWDNDQVIIRNYIPKSNLKVRYIIQGKNETGSTGRWFLDRKLSKNKWKSEIINKLLS